MFPPVFLPPPHHAANGPKRAELPAGPDTRAGAFLIKKVKKAAGLYSLAGQDATAGKAIAAVGLIQ
ncbi:hypothetical protein NS277_02405 [Novosphingobium barchaimii]|nr:hypothetical protein NS277_02405 [Novosphingobium barchaimii]